MSTKIIAGNGTNPGASLSSDTSGILEIATGASQTTAITVGSDQVVAFAAGGYGLMKRATAVNTTSGSAIDFTGLPAWVKRITVMLNGVSLTGADDLLIQLGTSGGVAVSGYQSGAMSSGGTQTGNGGFKLTRSAGGADLCYGVINLFNLNGNTWVASGNIFKSGGSSDASAGAVTLSGAVTSLRLTSNGTSTFDAGTVNLIYEG